MILKTLNLDAYVKKQFGSSASVKKTGDHLYDWKVLKGGKYLNLDLDAAAKWQYGSNHRSIATGVHAYDWAAINIKGLDYYIVPVLIVPVDQFYNIEGVRKASDYLMKGVNATRDWYKTQLGTGKTFRTTEKPIILQSKYNAAEWENFAAITDIPDTIESPPGSKKFIPNPKDTMPKEENRWVLLNRSKDVLVKNFAPINGPKTIVCMAPFTKFGSTASGAGAAHSNYIMAEPPSLVAVDPNSSATIKNQVMYALGHELGHAFGLEHTCKVLYPNPKYPSTPGAPENLAPAGDDCFNSIMQNPDFTKAKFVAHEKKKLASCPFLF